MRLWLYMKSYLYIIHNKRKIVNYFMRLIYIDSVSISTHLPSWISWLIDKNYLIFILWVFSFLLVSPSKGLSILLFFSKTILAFLLFSSANSISLISALIIISAFYSTDVWESHNVKSYSIMKLFAWQSLFRHSELSVTILILFFNMNRNSRITSYLRNNCKIFKKIKTTTTATKIRNPRTYRWHGKQKETFKMSLRFLERYMLMYP